MKTTKQTRPPLQPLGDRVLLRQVEQGERKIGQLIIPQGAIIDAPTAVVITLGDGQPDAGQTTKHSFRVTVGDLVVLPPHQAPTIKLDGVRYQIRRESDILGVLPKP